MSTSYGIHCPACKQSSEMQRPAQEWAAGLIKSAWYLKRCQALMDSFWFEPQMMGHGSDQIDFAIAHAGCGVLLQVVDAYGRLVESVEVEMPVAELTQEVQQKMVGLADVLALTASELSDRLNEL